MHEAGVSVQGMTAIVQVNGKVRERLEVPPTIGGDDLEKLAMESPSITRALEGKTVVNVVVRAPKVVSIQVSD